MAWSWNRAELAKPAAQGAVMRRCGCLLAVGLAALSACTTTTPAPEPAPSLAPFGDIRIGVELVSSDRGDHALPEAWSEPGHASLPVARVTQAPPLQPVTQDTEPRPRVADARPNQRPGLRPITRREIAEREPGIERVTLRFMQALTGYDANRLPRELGWGLMLRQQGLDDVAARDFWHEEQDAAVFEDALQELGPRLLSRPTRHALREMPLLADIEQAIADFKIHHVPISGTYRDSRDEDRRRYGHVSLRFQQSNAGDPITVAYSLEGWRFGTSQHTLQLGYSQPLGDALWFGVGTRFDHFQDRFEAMAEMTCLLSHRTRMLLTVGNEINAFPGPTVSRLQRPEAEGDAGVSLYVETIF